MIHKLKERCISECSLVLISLNSSFYGFPRSTARREGDGSVPTLAWSLSMTLLFGRRQETTHNLSSFVRQSASSGWSRKWGSTGTADCLRMAAAPTSFIQNCDTCHGRSDKLRILIDQCIRSRSEICVRFSPRTSGAECTSSRDYYGVRQISEAFDGQHRRD